MSRAQFQVLLAGSFLVLLALLLQVVFALKAQTSQRQLLIAQQAIANGRDCDLRLRQLATRIYQVSMQTQDQNLKELLSRQNIAINPGTNAAPSQPAASTSATR